jgi:hypothetical protein
MLRALQYVSENKIDTIKRVERRIRAKSGETSNSETEAVDDGQQEEENAEQAIKGDEQQEEGEGVKVDQEQEDQREKEPEIQAEDGKARSDKGVNLKRKLSLLDFQLAWE